MGWLPGLFHNQIWLGYVAAIVILTAIYRLAVAMRYYLKLDHALLTVLAVQSIVTVSIGVTVMSIQPLLYWFLRCFQRG
jgi:hypothetical protein